MNQPLSYHLKVWLTTQALVVIVAESATFYRLSQPNHSRDFLDPAFTLLVCVVLATIFLPAFLLFRYLIKPVSKQTQTALKTKFALSGIAAGTILVTASLLLLCIPNDLTYLWIGLFYAACMVTGIWIYQLPYSDKTGEL